MFVLATKVAKMICDRDHISIICACRFMNRESLNNMHHGIPKHKCITEYQSTSASQTS